MKRFRVSRKQAWELTSAILLLAVVSLASWEAYLAYQTAHHILRRKGFTGQVVIPGKGVVVHFQGDTCVEIDNGRSRGRGSCCIGHNSCQNWYSSSGVMVTLQNGWFDISF